MFLQQFQSQKFQNGQIQLIKIRMIVKLTIYGQFKTLRQMLGTLRRLIILETRARAKKV